MSYIPDLQTLESGFVAVGWLHPDHPFSQAEPATNFVLKLTQFAERSQASAMALGLGAAGGYHTCEFCEQAYGIANFGVPSGEKLFYSPEMIAHYVEAHRYAPPAEYIEAILVSPLPGTREYVNAVAEHLKRRNDSEFIDGVTITLERDVALVLFEFLSQFSDRDEFRMEESADQVAIWTITGSLESILVEPFDPKYAELLNQARRRVANYGQDKPDE